MGLTALCPGTFDPVTNGHLDVVRRAAGMFDGVVVAVLENPSKAPLFTVQERAALLEESLRDLPNVRVGSFGGLLVDYARSQGADLIVKGLRAVSDYEYEIQMAQMNQRIGGIETLFLATSPKWSFLSSSLVKEVARHGGDVEGLVPDAVRKALRRPTGSGLMDLAGRLAQLEQIVQDAKSMPLSSSVLISRDEVLEMLHEMQESLPEEIKQARWVVKDREELLAKARAEGDRIIEQAHEDQRRMSMKDAVAKRAQEESARMLQEAEDTTVGMRREAEDYVDAKLAAFEIALRKILEDAQATARSLAKTLDQVEVGRDRLRTPTTVAEQELAPPDLQAEPSELFDGEAGGEGFG